MSVRTIALYNPQGTDLTVWENYLEAGGGEGLERALAMAPVAIIDEVIQAGLRGRGGAGFSTGIKEQFTTESRPSCFDHYLVCNADEGEPGTFKDKVIMERAPLRLIEGMVIAARAIAAKHGYIYIRGEYTRAIERVETALQTARRAGWLGRIFSPDNSPFEITVRRGAGSYLCGEELTLIESLEGRRGHPRIKPPFPAERGLFGKPTLVNNVETFAHLPAILRHGSAWYREVGTEGSTGTKVFCLSGDVRRSGVVEAPMGLTLRDLVYGFGQGPSQEEGFWGAITGGAAGTFVHTRDFDLPLAYETLQKRGLSLGSGAVILIGRRRDLKGFLLSILEFFEHESCGKCVPCRVGMSQLSTQLKTKALSRDLLHGMSEQARFMAQTSLCPLGQSPQMPIDSFIKAFSEELWGVA